MIGKASRVDLLDQLENAIKSRAPQIALALRCGLPRDEIVALLAPLGCRGEFSVLVDLFSWKNGLASHFTGTLSELALFPESIYVFHELAAMVHHYREFRETFIFHPLYEDLRGRHFPLFWDGSTGYIAVDLADNHGAIVLLEPESEELAKPVYKSFSEFLKDAVSANLENRPLLCFE